MINLVFLYCRLQRVRNTQRIFDENYQYDPSCYADSTRSNLTYDGHDITTGLWCQEEVQEKKTPDEGVL